LTQEPQQAPGEDSDVLRGVDPLFTTGFYADPGKLLSLEFKSKDEIVNDPEAIFVLDTNVLLLPYHLGARDLLDELRNIYKALVDAERLVVPGHALREFVKNRQDKYRELFQQFKDWKAGTFGGQVPAPFASTAERKKIID
jgi:PIN like domain